MQVMHVYLVSHTTSLLLPGVLPRYLTSYQSHQHPSVFSDHFPFAIKDSDHSLTQTETSIRNPKGGQKPPALAAEGAS